LVAEQFQLGIDGHIWIHSHAMEQEETADDGISETTNERSAIVIHKAIKSFADF